MIVVITIDAYPFLAYSDLAYHPVDTEIDAFWLFSAT